MRAPYACVLVKGIKMPLHHVPASFIFLNYVCVKTVCCPLCLNGVFNRELIISSRQDRKPMIVGSTSPLSIKIRESEFQYCPKAHVD